MKLSNKGISLIELLISIVLIGVVLIFMFQLMVDLKNETNNNDFAYNNQVNRTEVIYNIQNDLLLYTLEGIEDKSAENIEIVFYFKGLNERKSSKLTSTYETKTNILNEEEKTYYLTYESVIGEKHKWEMKGAAIDPCGMFTYYIDGLSDNYYIKLNINLYNYVYHSRNNLLWHCFDGNVLGYKADS